MDDNTLWRSAAMGATALLFALVLAIGATGTRAVPLPIAPVLLPYAATAPAAYPPLEWDTDHAAALGVTLERSACEGGCWRLIALDIKDDQEGGGRHGFYARAYQMEQVPGVEMVVSWAEGSAHSATKAAPEWGDIPLWQCYSPHEGPGPYSGALAPDSDTIRGMGLPECQHESFWSEWVWEPGE